MDIADHIKFFGTTEKEVESKKFSIFIGISLGNKLLTKELARGYLEWALGHTKDKVAILIADEIDAINWQVFNGLNKEKALEKVANKAKAFVDMFAWATETVIKNSGDQRLREKINVLLWKDIKILALSRSIGILNDEFRINPIFRDRVLSFVNKYCNLRKKLVDEAKKVMLADYILAELPTILEGIDFKGVRYNMLLYPTYVDSGLSQFVLDIQNGVYPDLLSKLQLSTKCVMADAYLENPVNLF